MTDVFISYSRKDIAFARQLHESLVKQGLDTWIDWQDIPPSVDWLAEVYEAIEGADAFVFVISNTSLQSEICNLEIQHAAKHNKRLIPIAIDNIDASQVPKELAVINWIIFDEAGEKFSNALENLVDAITIDQVWVKAHTQFENRALTWDRKGQIRELLLRGSDLTEAENWLIESAGKDPQPTALQTQFILKSRDDSTRRQRQLLMSTGAALILLVVLTIWAVFNGQRAKSNEELALANASTAEAAREEAQNSAAELSASLAELNSSYVSSIAINNLDSNYDLSSLLAIESYLQNPSRDTYGNLLTTVQHNPRLEKIMVGDNKPVMKLAFNPEGSTLISLQSSLGSSLIYWDIASGQQIGTPITDYFSSSFAISPDGRYVFLNDVEFSEYFIRRWDIANRIEIAPPFSVLPGFVASMEISPNGLILATISNDSLKDRIITLWDLGSGKGNSSPIPCLDFGYGSSLAFSPEGKLLAAGGESSVCMINVEKQQMSSQIAHNTTAPYSWGWGLDIHPDGDTLAVSNGTEIELWRISTGKQFLPPLFGHTESIRQVVFSPDGSLLASAGDDDTIRLWDVFNGNLIGKPIKGHTEDIWALEFSPDGSLLASGSYDGSIRIWNMEKYPGIINKYVLDHHDSNAIVLSSDGRTMISGGHGFIKFWDVESGGNLKYAIDTREENVVRLAISPDGTILAAVNSNQGNLIKLWDTTTLSQIAKFHAGEEINQSNSLRFSPDGSLLASGGYDGILRLWNIKSGKITNEVETRYLRSIADIVFSPDGAVIYTGGPESVFVWDARTLTLIKELAASDQDYVTRIAISNNGSLLAASGGSGTIWIWNIHKGHQIVKPISTHNGEIKSLVFTPDDSMLVTGSSLDIRFWDVDTGQQIGLPYDGPGYSDYVDIDLSFGLGDKTLVAAGYDEIQTWDLNPNSWIAKLCQQANRNLTQEEWETYFPDETYRETCSN